MSRSWTLRADCISRCWSSAIVESLAWRLCELEFVIDGCAGRDVDAGEKFMSFEGLPPKRDKPAMTVDEQSKLKKRLIDARDRQAAVMPRASGD
jgi:hypothetical protein